MRLLRQIKTIEKLSLIPVAINISIWSFHYWGKADLFRFFGTLISILFAYILIYLIVRSIIGEYTNRLTREINEYNSESQSRQKFKLNSSFFEGAEREYTCYIFIGLLVLDGVALSKFDYSILSIVNTLVGHYGRN